MTVATVELPACPTPDGFDHTVEVREAMRMLGVSVVAEPLVDTPMSVVLVNPMWLLSNRTTSAFWFHPPTGPTIDLDAVRYRLVAAGWKVLVDGRGWFINAGAPS